VSICLEAHAKHMLDTLHVVSTECPHATYVAHHMPQHCCMPCSDAHLPVSLHKPIRTAAVAQISATSGALNSVQLLALSIQCNFWHSQFSATSGTLNSVQLPALPTSSLEAPHGPKQSTTLVHSVTELFQHPHQTPSWPHWTPYP